jgi:hypothetical protein
MAALITYCPTTTIHSAALTDQELPLVTACALRSLHRAIIFFLVLLMVSGCSATGRQLATKSASPQEPTPAREARADSTGNKPTAEVTSSSGTKGTQSISQPGRHARKGQTELETAKKVASELAKKHSPVENMTICYAKQRDEWWITLFQDEGHAFEVKRYIWNTREDRIEPYLVPKTIPRGDLPDYLDEKPEGRVCTAFEHTRQGWTARTKRSSSLHPADSSQRPTKTVTEAATHPRASQTSRSKEVRFVSGDDKKPALKVRNVSIPLRPSTDYVFTYGSEMKHTDLLRWLRARGYDTGLVVDASAARLNGYDFVWNYFSPVKGGGTANIEPHKDAVVWGLLLEVDSRLMVALDRKLGNPMSYGRGPKRIPVRRVEDDRTVLAWVYTAKPNRNGRTDIWPTPTYKKGIVEAATFWGFPRQYVERLRNWSTSR